MNQMMEGCLFFEVLEVRISTSLQKLFELLRSETVLHFYNLDERDLVE